MKKVMLDALLFDQIDWEESTRKDYKETYYRPNQKSEEKPVSKKVWQKNGLHMQMIGLQEKK